MQKIFQVGTKTFVLDQAKAEAAFAEKRVINGKLTMTFNLLPLKYQWAYEIYRKMKANHWEPEDIPMGRTSSSGRTPSWSRTSSAGSSGWASDTFPRPRASWGTTSSTW